MFVMPPVSPGPPPPQPTCSEYTTQEDCEANGCYWYDGSCHSEPPLPPPPLSGNLCPNPSVEEDTNADEKPDYWSKGKYDDVTGTHVWCPLAYTGTKSLVIKLQPCTECLQWHSISWGYQNSLDSPSGLQLFERGKTYKLRCWAQTSGCQLRVYVAMWDAQWNYIDTPNWYVTITSAEWKQSDWLQFAIPAEASHVTVGIAIRLEDIDVGVAEALGRADDFELLETSAGLSIFPTGSLGGYGSTVLLTAIIAVSLVLIWNNRKFRED